MSDRYDAWIVWGHGLEFIRQIAFMIRGSGFLRICYIKMISARIDENFIKNIYKEDIYPWPHLVAKSKYLLSTPHEIIVILTKNTNVKEIWIGDGAFYHKECSNIKKLKNDIRDRFNPRCSDGKRTEHHIIHGTDFEEQTVHLLSIFKLPNLDYFKQKEIAIPRHNRTLNLSSLYGNIIGSGPVSLLHTPHYAYVSGNFEPYITYIDKHLGRNLHDDHFPEAFDNLIKHINNYCQIICTYDFGDKIVISDGLHRACILKFLGEEEILAQHKFLDPDLQFLCI